MGFIPGMFATHSYQGRIYGIPTFPSVEVIWYNKELFAKNGWKTPQTWDEFLVLCARIKIKGYIPVAMGGQDPWTILHPYMYMVDRVAGRDCISRPKPGKQVLRIWILRRLFVTCRIWLKEEYLPLDVLSLNYTEATELMIQDKALMMFMGDWEYGRLTNQMRQDFNRWDFFTFPRFFQGKERRNHYRGG